ncbi:MAG: hypothetical protein KAJ57_11625 [Woeseiaceae bacterium]|nr:hypothetical protein [Woeseiaceae bacterium]
MRFLVTFFALALLASSALAEEAGEPDPLFQSTETLQVTLSAPFTTLVDERPTEEYVAGQFEFSESNGGTVVLDVKIQARGHLRHEICDFPPLRLNFKKSQTKGTLFNKQDKMKLVVHCSDSMRYQQSLLREYLAYRILNIITPVSFGARLLRVTYVDSEGQRDNQIRYAFLIEHKNRLGKRFDMKDLKIEESSIEAIQPELLNLTSIFQFFISNTDFSPVAKSPYDECCHNYDMFSNDTDLLVAVPYDFDQAGLVNAPYAAPSEQFPIRNVRQRLYRGRCVNNDYVEASLQRFQDRRDSIYELVSKQEGLTSTTRKSLISFIDYFYKIIDDPRKVERYIINRCI